MTCLKKIQNTEVFGSKFSSRTLTTVEDISGYSFKAVVKNIFQGKILEIAGIKNAGTINFDFSQLQTLKKSTYQIEYWGDFGALGNEPFLLEELSIVSAENATNCANSDNLNFEIKFEEISIPVTITKAINNFSLNIESLTPEQIALIKGSKGDKGEKGDKGDDGSDANVTAENIKSALGFVPQEKLTEDNVGEFMLSELATKSAPTSGDTVLAMDSVTGKAVRIPTDQLGGGGSIDISTKLDKGTYTGNASDLRSLIDTKADLVDGKVPLSQLPAYNETKKATITVELISQLTTNFYAPNALRINSTALISGSGTLTLKVNDVAYTLTNLIPQGAKITATTTSPSVYNLISIYE